MVLAFATLLIVGCSQPEISVARVGDTYPSRDKNSRVDVFIEPNSAAEVMEAFGVTKSPSSLPRSARLIGRIDGSGRVQWQYLADPILKRTRELGGDAILIDDAVKQRVYRKKAWEDEHYRAIAIRVYRYRSEEPS